jgi:hypothetical protein
MKKAMLIGAALTALVAPALHAQRTYGPVGGAGQPFNDDCDVAQVRVYAGWWVDGVQLICRDGTPTPHRGGTGGTMHVFELQPGESIRAISGAAFGEHGPYIYALQFHTDRRDSPLFGNAGPSKGRDAYRFDVPEGSEFLGLSGRSSDYLNAIGIRTSERSQYDIPKPDAEPQVFYIWVKTGTTSGAGTDANIHIEIRGSAATGEVRLDKPNYDDFERGDLDLYQSVPMRIGTIDAIMLKSDGSGAGADWYVEWVCVGTDPNPNESCRDDQKYIFNRWLNGRVQTNWIERPRR